MEKFYLKNNRIKLIRFIVSYIDKVKTDTLHMKSEVKQFLNTSTELEEILDRLNRKSIVPDIQNIDISSYEIYEDRIVSSYEEADKLINPNIDDVRNNKIKELEDSFNIILSKGFEIELSGGRYNISCTYNDLYILENCKKSENYEVFLNNERVLIEKDDFDKLYAESNKFYNDKYSLKNELILRCRNASSVEEINTINFE